MVTQLFYALHFLLLLGCVLSFTIKKREQRIAFALIQILIALPLLSGQYWYFYLNFTSREVVPLLFFAESCFGVMWLSLVLHLASVESSSGPESRSVPGVQLVMLIGLLGMLCYSYVVPTKVELVDGLLIAPAYSTMYFYALLLLASVLVSAWRLEVFWRTLAPQHKRAYRIMVVAGYLICGSHAWVSSYRITYHLLVPMHFVLLAILFIAAWGVIAFTVTNHGLLHRKIALSRQMAYTFIAPTVFAIYMLALGGISLLMKTFGLPLPFILRGIVLAISGVVLIYYLCSPSLRRKVHFFINTHLYENKYAYKEEWQALSTRLQGVETELDVACALHDILTETVYSKNIVIWLGDQQWGYKPVYPPYASEEEALDHLLKDDDSLITYLSQNGRFYLEDIKTDVEYQRLLKEKKGFLRELDLVLMVPFFINEQLVGIISLGSEFKGAHYGYDDFDLLAALGTQAASTIVAVRLAKQSADAREKKAWDRLSAFVLHDVKNASAMLSLVRENAPAHIHKPQFQNDMLEAIDDSLARMGKVQEGLDTLKEETTPNFMELDLKLHLHEYCFQMEKKLRGLTIRINCPSNILFSTDPSILSRVLENLLLNAYEASGDPPSVNIEIDVVMTKYQVVVQVTDNGPGIDEAFLPEVLFEPFKTNKKKGSGIGLWQVKQMVHNINGSIQASNVSWGGARFIMRLPL